MDANNFNTKAAWLAVAASLLVPGCYAKEEPRDSAAAGETEGTGGSGEADTEGDATEGTGSDDNGSADETAGNDTNDSNDSEGDDAELELLITTLCDWDFNCCSRGELDYRLGPFTDDAAECTDRFIEQLYSNDDANVESPRADLLYILGYAVRLDRSTPNPDMVSSCRDLLETQACNEPAVDGFVACTAADDPTENPCDLRNMFTGSQQLGDPCSEALAALDIECVAGSSCEELDGVFICVDKGLEGDFCESDTTCDQGLFCDVGQGLCAPRRAVGQSCSFDDAQEPDAGTETLPCLEHLSCDVSSSTCVAYCTDGYDCQVDQQCPETHSCIPHDIGDGTYTYCAERGDTNGDRCDSDHDCADSMHCAGDSCATDIAQGQSCGTTNECQAGLYCAGTCEVVLNNGQSCSADMQCNPSTTLGCITSDDGQECRNALLANGDVCVPGERSGNNWCASTICEDLSEDGINNPECQPGALAGAACDESNATDDVPRCAAGLYCLDDVCKTQLDSGGDCEDDGGQQCLNGACSPIWEGEYCTDATPTGVEGVVTCDGQD